jgi:two-component system probable response regulator PhcQ
MENLYDYKRFAILYVDDEEKSLKYFARAFGDHFRILTATNATDGFALLQQHRDDIGLLMTDQRMPGEKGVQLLERTRQLNPSIIRVLATAYADLEAAIQAVNTGAIYKYVTKPWEIPQLEATLRRGLEFFMVQRERDMLLREKVSVLHKLMITDRLLSLGIIAAGLGHQVQNALGAVQQFLEIAPTRGDVTGPALEEFRHPTFWKEFYDKVQTQTRRLSELLRLLGLGSPRPAPRFDQEVHLAQIVRDSLTRFASRLEDQGIVVDCQIADTLPPLRVDAPVFSRLFDFLLEDELCNLPKNSRLEFRARKVELPGHVEPGVEIEVVDNGPGLPAAALRSVLDPFQVRQAEKLEFGLNLMACYFVVYHHGGQIDASDRADGGARYRLTLPTRPAPAVDAVREQEFLNRVLLNDALWERLLTTS